ncbi:MAG: response regulator [Myxococcota bacterium]
MASEKKQSKNGQQAEYAHPASSGHDSGVQSSSKGRILIIDDSEISRQAVRIILEGAGYDVIELESARDATRVILREVPDLVLMDVVMPDLAGDKAVEAIRAGGALRNTQVLLFSQRSKKELEALAQDCGADGYLQKSAEGDVLIGDVERWMARTS